MEDQPRADAPGSNKKRGARMGEEMNVLPVHPTTGLVALGVLPSGRIVWPVLGGSGEDEPEPEEPEAEIDEPGTEPDDEPEPEPEKKPEPKTDEEKVSRAALDKAIRERQRAKENARTLQKELEELRRANEGAEEKAARETREKVQAELEKKYKPLLVEKTARADLIAAGVKPDGVKRMIRLMDLGEIEVSDDGEVVGLDEQIDGLKADYPELFGQPEPEKKPERRGSRAADGADKKPEPKKPLSATERQAMALQGRTG